MTRYHYILLLLLTLSLAAVASSPRSVKVHAEGTAVGKNIDQAKRQALFNAKCQALAEAGVHEQVSSTSLLNIGSAGITNSTNVADEVSLLSHEGQLRLLGEPEYGLDMINDLISCTATIRAEVFLDGAPDPAFAIRVQGLAGSYHNGDEIALSITPSHECYLRLFCFDIDDDHALRGALYYPSEFFNDLPFSPNQSYTFPAFPMQYCRSTLKQLTAELSPHKKLETTVVVVVALKEPRLYNMPSVDFDSLLQWLATIPLDQRTLFFQQFVTVQ